MVKADRRMGDLSIYSFEQELQRFPPAVISEFQKAAPLVKEALSEADFSAWAEEGVAIARSGSDGWKVAVECFRVSPQALKSLNSTQLVDWVRCGRVLSGESDGLALAYFQASSAALDYLKSNQIEQWVGMGKRLCQGTRQSTSFACRFLRVSPDLLRFLTIGELEKFAAFIQRLAPKSYEYAGDCLESAEDVLSRLEKQDRECFLEQALLFAETNWNDVRTCFLSGPKILSRIEGNERARFLSLAQKISQRACHHVLPFLMDGSEALGRLPASVHHRLLALTEELLALSCFAATEFLKSCPGVLSRVGFDGLESWFREGARTLGKNEEGGIAYFRTELKKSTRFLEELSAGVELSLVRDVLAKYCLALTAREVPVLSTRNLREKEISWASLERPSTEGTAVLLPELVEKYATKEENFAWYKVMATHQAGHLEFGSFDFCFEKEASLFDDLRFELAQQVTRRYALTDQQRFFDLFNNRDLASDIFTVVEDGRVDYLLNQEYRGITREYGKIQNDALNARPSVESLPLKGIFLEIMIRISLGSTGGFPVPSVLHAPLRQASLILKQVQSSHATVEDSAEATLRLYQLFSQIPNRFASSDSWEVLDLNGNVKGPAMPSASDIFQQFAERPDNETNVVPYTSPQEVEFRGEFKPEMVQWLLKLKAKGQQKSEEIKVPPSPQAFEGHVDEGQDIEPSELFGGEPTSPRGLFVADLKQAGRQREEATAMGEEKAKGGGDSSKKALERDDTPSYLYDEWDFRANDYKQKWCRVRQKAMDEGVPDFFEETLNDYAGLLSRIKEEFERLNPQFFRKMKRLHDGHEFDMDAVVNFVVEKKAGRSPSDKIYWRRNKTERDVSVVFLLDMSSSTIEYIDERQGGTDRMFYARDYKGYLEWLQYHHDYQGRPRAFKRIIDLEKESVVLLIKALETIGDTYALYGFSGSGRENVEFYVIKDIEEEFSDRIKRRIDSISPLSGTRMGPAIRHATWKLEKQPAKSKFLFLISDGRPQDHGYGRDGLEKEYAINDTKMAFVEAMRKSITPFCLTVDRGGHDYLRTMCRDMGYEVVAEIESLPERLPSLYRKLTV